MKRITLTVCALFVCAVMMASCSGSSGEAYTAGVVEGNVYSSDWMDFTFTPAEGVTMLGGKELTDAMGSALGDDSYGQHYEMMATGAMGETVLVTVTEMLGSDKIDDYLDMFEEQLSELGYPVTVNERSTVNFAGNKYHSVQYTVNMDGIAVEQLLYVRINGGYAAELYFTYTEQSELDALLACFAEK